MGLNRSESSLIGLGLKVYGKVLKRNFIDGERIHHFAFLYNEESICPHHSVDTVNNEDTCISSHCLYDYNFSNICFF